MAEIAPFRGILYTDKAGAPSSLLAPPYDVIGEADRAHLESLSPYNCVRLILPRPEPGQSQESEESKYAHAGSLLRAWRDAEILGRDGTPAIYRYHQLFVANGHDVVRKGF